MNRLKDKLFGLVFDGSSFGTLHLIAIFAVYEENGRVVEDMLCASPPLEEDEMRTGRTFGMNTQSTKSLQTSRMKRGRSCAKNSWLVLKQRDKQQLQQLLRQL